jgi:hypothetical protein
MPANLCGTEATYGKGEIFVGKLRLCFHMSFIYRNDAFKGKIGWWKNGYGRFYFRHFCC